MADGDFECQRSASGFALKDGLVAVATASSIGFSENAILFSICHVSRTHGVKFSNYVNTAI